jgi:hypothetical protein
VTRCSGVTTSVEGEAAPGRGKGVDDASWADVNLTRPKNKKIYTVYLAPSNGW